MVCVVRDCVRWSVVCVCARGCVCCVYICVRIWGEHLFVMGGSVGTLCDSMGHVPPLEFHFLVSFYLDPATCGPVTRAYRSDQDPPPLGFHFLVLYPATLH